MMQLKKIEKRIIEIQQILADKDRERQMASGVPMSTFEGRLKNANRPLMEELEQLNTERIFILDRRGSLFWKIIWNVLVPIVVTIVTTFLMATFLGDQSASVG